MTEQAETGAGQKCPKCGAEEMIPDVSIQTAQSLVYIKLKLGGFFSKRAQSYLKASVCGKCGFMELYAKTPAPLREAHLARQAQAAKD
jgi:predicted nucleic-acid-binding Zn-ribbon protein